MKGVVQVVKKHGGENNLHYHTRMDTFWMVLKGRVRFYGPGDVVLGEFGPHEGMVTPRYSRYWFENIGDEDLELLAGRGLCGRRHGRRPHQRRGAEIVPARHGEHFQRSEAADGGREIGMR